MDFKTSGFVGILAHTASFHQHGVSAIQSLFSEKFTMDVKELEVVILIKSASRITTRKVSASLFSLKLTKMETRELDQHFQLPNLCTKVCHAKNTAVCEGDRDSV